MKKLNKDLLEETVTMLADLTEAFEPSHFVVCGGSSLLALGLVRRKTTRDVDLLARVQDGELVNAGPLPPPFVEAIEKVRRDFSLLDNWFNTAPSDDTFFRFGFPEGMLERVETRPYGRSLTLSYISRYDQIHFKLYAAADSGPGRHLDDLVDLAPSEDELVAAIRWVFLHDDSEGFRFNLSSILTILGHDGLLERF